MGVLKQIFCIFDMSSRADISNNIKGWRVGKHDPESPPFFIMENQEIWKDIAGYEGKYQISNLGRVKSLQREIKSKFKTRVHNESILSCPADSNGYRIVSIRDSSCVRKTHKVHQLVAIAFLGHSPCGHKLVVNHKNFIRTDNCLENLEIITTRENTSLKHKKSSSKFIGVSWCRMNNKWSSSIRIHGKQKFLGYFTDEIQASNAYQNALANL